MGLFLIGIGTERLLESKRLTKEYETSELLWKRKYAEGEAVEKVRDYRNQELEKSRNCLTMEKELYLEDATALCELRFSNALENSFSCVISIIRDSTGETLYESGLIEPGFSIETVYLSGALKKGTYPCTVLARFFTKSGEYAGETAWKVVVIIKN